MRIDQTHRTWFMGSVIVLTLAVILYFPYALLSSGGPNGNTWPGLIYGILGYGMMLYAGLMGARKRVPLWRIGRAKTWMRGHLWMGALSFPMILLHSGFMARGPLTMVLMTLLGVVVASGVVGALLQHFIPKRITATVPLETIYEQIPVVRDQLFAEATGIIERLCSVTTEVEVPVAGAAAVSTGYGAAAVAEEDAGPELTEAQQANLRGVYNSGILPFLTDPDRMSDSPLADATKAKAFFDALRKQMPPATHEALGDIESICEEERQLKVQKRKYLYLHAWLLVHVPLSVTLLVLGGIHALVAIHY